jgi:mediator of RNA polymerase II transcription subunit 13
MDVCLLESIEGNLAFKLAREGGLLRIAPWTWTGSSNCAPPGSPEPFCIEVKSRIWPDGSLYLLHQLQPYGSWIPTLDPAQTGEIVMLAPFGIRASVSDIPTSFSEDSRFKQYIGRIVACEGIELSATTSWLTVQNLGILPKPFIWPKQLCLSPFNSNSRFDSGEDSQTWRNWFQLNEGHAFQDPLSVAERWLQSAGTREPPSLTVGPNTTPGNDAAMDFSMKTSSEAEITNADLIPSPSFNQRLAEQQAALSGIYPTPPDGLAQTSTSAQSGLDHSSSETQNEIDGSLEESGLDGNDLQYRIQRYDSSASQQIFPVDQVSSFGTREDIEFAENDIEDADFNFFDEPDDERTVAQMDDVSMSESVTAIDEQVGTYVLSDDLVPDRRETLVPSDPVNEGPDTVEQRLKSQTDQDRPESVDANKEDGTNRSCSESLLKKPLSPFGVKERLFPPPIPASLAHGARHEKSNAHREGTYSPVVFREGLSFATKYGPRDLASTKSSSGISSSVPSIALPPHKRNHSNGRPKSQRDTNDEDDDSGSDADSYSSSLSESEASVEPMKLLEDRKRKRGSLYESVQPPIQSHANAWIEEENQRMSDRSLPESTILDFVQKLSRFRTLAKITASASVNGQHADPKGRNIRPRQPYMDDSDFVEKSDALSKQDLMFVAQLVGEQAVTSAACFGSVDNYGDQSRQNCNQAYLLSFSDQLSRAVEAILPGIDQLDIVKSALVREPFNRAMTNQGKTPAGPPRPPQRSETAITGPDLFNLPTPHIRIQRFADNWELLPTCLQFWETLGLGPASGAKDVRAFCVFPSNTSLENAVKRFMAELGSVYERCKLGTHAYQRQPNAKDGLGVYDDGMAPVTVEEDSSLNGIMKAYSRTCAKLGKALATMATDETSPTIVVYMINPFSATKAVQHLCACFWRLFKSYRDRLPKTDKSVRGADILLQLVPIRLVASFDAISIPEDRQMALLAREVYDRCPPSPFAPNTSSPIIPILAAPSIELAGPSSKRVQFQLTEHPSEDLMHEGSLLHLAYSRSADQHWLNVVWMDNTGQSQSSAVYCVRGRSFADAAQAIWDRTREILDARQVMWRVYIVTDEELERATASFWQSIVSKPRSQLLCVTLLTVRADPALMLAVPIPADISSMNGADLGTFTPAATPQATNNMNSPDVAGHSTAPPTPAPSEPAMSMNDIDPDAHLVDLADESWAMLLCPKLLQMVNRHAMATGVWFRRGESDSAGGDSMLPRVGVSLYWTIQVKPGGMIEAGQPKHAEMALREVMRMYRPLAVLTKARGLDIGTAALLPVHVAVAAQGAAGLNGILQPSRE